jgi:hypothetical protein
MPFGRCEQVVIDALERLSPGPWTMTDLERVDDVMNDEVCGGRGPDCETSAVLDWLRTLDVRERADLVYRANAEWSLKQGTAI